MKLKKIALVLVAVVFIGIVGVSLSACMGIEKADTVKHNIQVDADNFKTFRRMTFINLRTSERMYCAEGYFSLQTTANKEIGLVFKVGKDEYKMDYFSVDSGVTYIIEQIENTTTNPYYMKITWYLPLPVVVNP